MLECLGLVESHLRQVDQAREALGLIQLIHHEAHLLSKFMRKVGLNCPALNEDLIDTIDGISFAINHDLQRVFDSPQRSASFRRKVPVDVGQMYRAHC